MRRLLSLLGLLLLGCSDNPNDNPAPAIADDAGDGTWSDPVNCRDPFREYGGDGKGSRPVLRWYGQGIGCAPDDQNDGDPTNVPHGDAGPIVRGLPRIVY